jgi:hypothetical protein
MSNEYVTLTDPEEIKPARGSKIYDREYVEEMKTASEMRKFLEFQARSISASMEYLQKQIIGTAKSAVEEIAVLRIRVADGQTDPWFTNWANTVEEKLTELKALGKQLEFVNEALTKSDQPPAVTALGTPEIRGYFESKISIYQRQIAEMTDTADRGRNATIRREAETEIARYAARIMELRSVLQDLTPAAE